MAYVQSQQETDIASAGEAPTAVSRKAKGISPKALRTTLLVVLGIQSALAAFIGALAVADGETELGLVFGIALVIYMAALVGVARRAKWGYWLTLVVGALSIAGAATGSGGSLGVGIGSLLASFSAIALFHPDHRSAQTNT